MSDGILGGQNNLKLCISAAEEILKWNSKFDSSTYVSLIMWEFRLKSDTDKLEVVQRITDGMGIACYIQGSLRISFFIAYVYSNYLMSGLLANANCGGECFNSTIWNWTELNFVVF